MKIVTAAEIKEIDLRATADFKIPSLLLMENAARGIVDWIEGKIGPAAGLNIVVLCGRGNNGGDGMAAARHLQNRLAHVQVYLLSPIDKVSGDAQTMLTAWTACGGHLHVTGAFSPEEIMQAVAESDLVLDALLGTGLNHPVHGEYAQGIASLNAVRREKEVTIVSIDIPSGISADTGEMMGIAVKADYTLTLGLPKRGLFLRDGLEHRGTWDLLDIGFPKQLTEGAAIRLDLIGPTDIPTPALRPLGAHKGDFGHLLLIAGSRGKAGAASLSALSALRSGVGLVTVAVPRSLDTVSQTVMEAMTLPVAETDEATLSLVAEKSLLHAAMGKAAVAIGPGLSQHPETVRLILNLISQMTLPMVIDADGLNALASDLSVLKGGKRPIILTPHPGEMGRLLGIRTECVQQDRIEQASEFAQKWGVIVVLKGAHTVIADPNGPVFLSNTGNPGMATAGTGDVLTGMIGGALAQGMRPIDAALWGVVMHGAAGDRARQNRSPLVATDIIAALGRAHTGHRQSGYDVYASRAEKGGK